MGTVGGRRNGKRLGRVHRRAQGVWSAEGLRQPRPAAPDYGLEAGENRGGMRSLAEAEGSGETTAASVKTAVTAAYPNLPIAILSYRSSKKSKSNNIQVYWHYDGSQAPFGRATGQSHLDKYKIISSNMRSFLARE